MRMLFALIPAGTLLALTGPVVAQTGNDDAVNACIQAAKQQHQGLLTGWAIDRGGVGAGVEISMVTSDDKRWKLACTDGKIKDEEQRLGTKDCIHGVFARKFPQRSSEHGSAIRMQKRPRRCL